MKRAVVIAAIAELCLLALLVQSTIKDFLWSHPWWHSFIVLIPTIAVPILAYLELRHSGEANEHRAQQNRLIADANSHRAEANRYREEANKLQQETHLLQVEIHQLEKEGKKS